MTFDIKQYTDAFDEFLVKMESISTEDDPAISDALQRLVKILRIGRFQCDFYETALNERQNKGNTAVYYDHGDFNEQQCYQQREVIGSGAVVIYSVYPRRNDELWSREEQDKIRLLVKMLFVFHGRVRTRRLVDYLTFHDKELGILNIAYFTRHLQTLIQQGCISDYCASFFNLRHFSSVNQQVGREKGTEVMLSFLKILSADFTENEIVARVGGDNFVVIFLKERLDYILDVFKGTEIISEGPPHCKLMISASAGLYRIPDTCNSFPEIMDAVSVSANIARNLSKESFVFFDDNLKNRVNESKIILDMFPEAIRNNEFEVYYQPKYNIKNTEIIGSEALCRWFHDGTMIMPGRFIPILEQSKAICTLDFYMLDHVCQDIRRWLDEGIPVVKVSINLSRCHFGDMNLLDSILKIIDKNNVPHEYVEIELTETTTDVNFRDLRRIVYGLKKAGISTAIDDFGIGYSSLNLLRELPWDILKIDKSFLDSGSEIGKNNYVMLKHIISMAQELGLECIVEGVESPEQVNLLKENNCYLVQGFLFDKPLPKDVYETRLNQLKK